MLKRIFTVSVVVMTIVWAVGLAAFVPTAQAAVASGDLIKASQAAVYYMGADGKRYVFPNEKTYMTWYPDFSGVKTITDAELAAIQIGGNVTMRPGVKMGKITTDPKVYAIGSNGTLRWVTTEAIAVCLYGANWGAMVDDISDAFFVNYTIGAPINDCADFSPAAVTAAASSINVDKGLVSGDVIPGVSFSVALASDNPASQTLAKLATGVPVLKFTLSGSGTLNELVLKRTGLGNSGDYEAVYLYNGDTRLTSGRSISSDTNTVTFTGINLAISGSVTLTAKVDIDAGALATNQNALSVQSINGNSVAGVNGNLMTIGNASATDVTIDRITQTWNVTLGSAAAELAKFSIFTDQNDAIIYAITLTQGGRLSNSNLANLKLKVGSAELASVAAMNGDKAIFVLGAPYTISKGQTKNFTVIGDITGGRTNDDVSFYVEEKTDANIKDGLYNVGANVTISADYNGSGDQSVIMQGGQLTLGNAGPASSIFSANSTANAILKVNVSSERNVTVKNTALKIAGTNFDADDLTEVKNIRLVDLDSGASLDYVSQIGDFKTALDGATACTAGDLNGAGCFYKLTNDYDLTAGTTRHLAVRVDFGTGTTDGLIINATYDLSTASYVRDNDSSEDVLPANIVPTSVAGVNQTVTTAQLTVTKAGIPTTGAYVKGATAVDALGINLNAGIADSLQLNRLTARIYADDDGTFTVAGPTYTGDTAANSVVLTASLYDGSTLVKGPVNLSLVDVVAPAGFTATGDYYKADFTNLAYDIPAGAQKKLVVRLSLSSNIATQMWTAVDLLVPTDLEVQNSMGNLVTAGTAGALNNGAATPVPMQVIGVAGTLAVAVDGNTTAADIALGGSTNVNTVKYKISATNEAFTVTGAQIRLSTTAVGGDVINVKVTYPNASSTSVTKTGQLSAGVLTFSDGQLDMYVPVNSSAIMTISADLNSTGAGATSGSVITLCLDNGSATCAGGAVNLTDQFIALGVSSNTKLFGTIDSITVDNTNVKGQTLRKTKVTAVNTHNGGASSLGQKTVVGKFKLNSTAEAGSNQNSTLVSVNITLSGSLIVGTPANISIYKGSIDNANQMNGVVPTAVACADNACTATIAFTANNEFSGDQEILVVADTTTAAFADTAGTETLSTALNTWTWNDGVDAATTPVAGYPVIPTNALTF